ncbi:MAG: CrcB protein [Lentisphaeria bacterium]|jgi:CrcB protein
MLWIAVALGGSLGAIVRYALSLAFMSTSGKLPYATLTANVIGSFLMGVFFVLIIHKGVLPMVWRHVVMVGFLGAFTTFSAFSIESLQLIQIGQWQLAIFYSVLSVSCCLVAAYLGYTLFDKLF